MVPLSLFLFQLNLYDVVSYGPFSGICRFLCVLATTQLSSFFNIFSLLSPSLSPLLPSLPPLTNEQKEMEKWNANQLLRHYSSLSSSDSLFFQIELQRLILYLKISEKSNESEREKEEEGGGGGGGGGGGEVAVGKKILRSSFASVVAAHFSSIAIKIQNEVSNLFLFDPLRGEIDSLSLMFSLFQGFHW